MPTAPLQPCPHPCSDVVEAGGSREHSFEVITPSRSYYLTASTAEEKK